MLHRTLWIVLSSCFALAWVSPGAAAQATAPAPPHPVSFSDQVRPILARHCFKCHGPDDKARKAKLRLDQEESAKKPATSGERPIVPGNPEESELVRRIFAEDADELMPPPAANLPLSQSERQTLKQWITDGAKYDVHWAFQKPVMPAIPKVRNPGWVRNPIDAFVLARLDQEGLKPSAEADRATLLRRASLDLIGLPPSLDEIDAFLADASPDAYERQVDRLLASPHYGERWARRWLDLARYADTNGYEKDRPRSIWPYRDWVIHALNAGLPFDRFTIEQLAGDMLPGADTSQKVATGFHRNTMLNEEGGIDPLEFRFYAMTDRVATTGTVWLGLTIGCAQCHTHKFDPIPHRDYYQFMALLNNADEPTMPVPSESSKARRRAIAARIAAMKADLPNQFPPGPGGKTAHENLERKFHEWLPAARAAAVRWTVLKPTKASANVPTLSIEPDGSVFARGDQSKRDVYTVVLSSHQKGITAIRLEALPDDSLPNRGPGRVYYEGPFGDFFLSEISLSSGGLPAPFKEATASNPKARKDAAAAIDGDPQTGWSINGGQGHEQAAVFRLATPLQTTGEITVTMVFERYYAAGLGRFRISATTDPRPIVAQPVPFDIEPLLLIPDDQRKPEQTERLRSVLSRAWRPNWPRLARRSTSSRARFRKTRPRSSWPSVLPTIPDRRSCTIAVSSCSRRSASKPAVLSMLPGMAADLPRNRLGLARWLVSGSNPLTGRVTMNRQWAAFFGKGIVRTVEDFGYQGERPSHPELLDWLALSLVEHGWSMKGMHRAIVTSATYRQISRFTPERAGQGPGKPLAGARPAGPPRGRGDPRRGAQSERAALRADRRPERLSAPAARCYDRGGLRRPGVEAQPRRRPLSPRPVHIHQADCPLRHGADLRRTQRRGLRGTPRGLELAIAGAHPAERSRIRGREPGTWRAHGPAPGTVEARIERLFRLCLARGPQAGELSMLVHFYHNQRERLERKELDAAKIAGHGEAPGAIDRAAWTVLARAILNLDETVTKG